MTTELRRRAEDALHYVVSKKLARSLYTSASRAGLRAVVADFVREADPHVAPIDAVVAAIDLAITESGLLL